MSKSKQPSNTVTQALRRRGQSLSKKTLDIDHRFIDDLIGQRREWILTGGRPATDRCSLTQVAVQLSQYHLAVAGGSVSHFDKLKITPKGRDHHSLMLREYPRYR